MSDTEAACQTPLADQRASAHRHYAQLADAAHCWASVIPCAIDFYFDAQQTVAASPVPVGTTQPVRERFCDRHNNYYTPPALCSKCAATNFVPVGTPAPTPCTICGKPMERITTEHGG